MGVLAAGCGGGSEIAPPTVHWGHDICHVCGMIVSDERYAAALVVAEERRYESRVYDDLGCLLEDAAGLEDERILARYVRAFDQDRWLEAAQARFLRSADLHSPMAYGVAACADDERAVALAAEYPGEVVSFAQLDERFMSGALHAAPGGPGG
jgi:nitrous oxide reductase accessory protein NosL